MKNILVLLLFLQFACSYKNNSVVGKYYYFDDTFRAIKNTILLKNNGKFVFKSQIDLDRVIFYGNYEIKNDTIIFIYSPYYEADIFVKEKTIKTLSADSVLIQLSENVLEYSNSTFLIINDSITYQFASKHLPSITLGVKVSSLQLKTTLKKDIITNRYVLKNINSNKFFLDIPKIRTIHYQSHFFLNQNCRDSITYLPKMNCRERDTLYIKKNQMLYDVQSQTFFKKK